ncbi:hypothetical protein CRG98_032879 [Punica granatum]|uniref:Uncharacterized protein n=1 Tax=Punica granatum TaxID=22663 RepID=A0A2I0IRX0_PUNGR|nr:hypothetical protein CRG98_032879 [Punica granatum]
MTSRHLRSLPSPTLPLQTLPQAYLTPNPVALCTPPTFPPNLQLTKQNNPMDSLYLGITSSQAHDFSPTGPIYLAHYSPDFPFPLATVVFYSPLARKRKIEFPTEEFVKRAAPYTATPNRMAISPWQQPDQLYYVEEIEDGDTPDGIQMADEAGPSMPPTYP